MTPRFIISHVGLVLFVLMVLLDLGGLSTSGIRYLRGALTISEITWDYQPWWTWPFMIVQVIGSLGLLIHLIVVPE